MGGRSRSRRGARPRLSLVALVLAAAFALWLVAGPVQVGGTAAYSMISGNSMEPLLHRGNLAAVRTGGPYHVGEVTLYQSRTLGRSVLHRIVGVHDGVYTFKGDNNSFVDPEAIPAADLVGTLWFHVAWLGTAMAWLRTPSHAGPIFGVVAALAAVTTLGSPGRRRSRRERRPRHLDARRRDDGSGPPLHDGWPAALITLVAILALGAYTYTRPLTEPVSKGDAFRHEGTFTYSSKLRAPNAAYPSGQADTGEPLFFDLFDSVKLRFAYRFASALPHHVEGTIALKALISDSTGWHQLYEVSAPVAFSGDEADTGGEFPLADFRAVFDTLAKNAGTTGGEYPVYLQPVIQVHGTVEGRAFTSGFTPAIPISVTSNMLKVAASPPPPPGTTTPSLVGADPLHPLQAGAALVDEPSHLRIARYSVSTTSLRALLPVLLVAWALAVALLVVLRRRRSPPDEAAIAAAHHLLTIPVASLDALTTLPTTVVIDFEGLASLAEDREAPLLVETTGDHARYAMLDAATVFLHQSSASLALALGPGTMTDAVKAVPRHAESLSAEALREATDHRRHLGGWALPAPRRLARLGAVLVPVIALSSVVYSFTATSVVPSSYIGVTRQTVTPMQLAPASCATLALTQLVVATQSSVTGTAANDLVLGLTGAGTGA
ncbi:MAG: peptidase signal peptidase, partial [Actinomycetia bacterium]|nr:peptidase signal peptidase [Actinomycetes bacterium]